MVSSGELEREMERGRGFLNGADRKWLLLSHDQFVEEHSRQYWGQRRDAIRERTWDALLDFSVLYEHLPDGQREKIWGPHADPRSSEEFGAGGESEEQQDPEKRLQQALLDQGLMCAMALFIEQRGMDRFEEILERAVAHVRAGERTPGRVAPATEGISVEIDVTHTDTVTPSMMAHKIGESGVDRLSATEQRALLHLLQSTGQKPPETADEFAEIYHRFITDHYEGDPVDMDRAVITLEPFAVAEGLPDIPAEGQFSDLADK